MDRQTASRTRSRRPTAPKPVRQAARAASLSLEELAEAVIDGQPRPERPRDQAALLHWLGQSVRNAHPGTPTDEMAAIMASRLQEMADGGDTAAKALLEAEVDGAFLNMARISLALAGGLTAPDPPAVPRQERQDTIASTVLRLTGWTSMDEEPVQAIYRWLFGDEAAFVAESKMRVEAGLHMLENRDPRPVRVPHPDTGELVLVTREEIIKHAEADGRPPSGTRRSSRRSPRPASRSRRPFRVAAGRDCGRPRAGRTHSAAGHEQMLTAPPAVTNGVRERFVMTWLLDRSPAGSAVSFVHPPPRRWRRVRWRSPRPQPAASRAPGGRRRRGPCRATKRRLGRTSEGSSVKRSRRWHRSLSTRPGRSSGSRARCRAARRAGDRSCWPGSCSRSPIVSNGTPSTERSWRGGAPAATVWTSTSKTCSAR